MRNPPAEFRSPRWNRQTQDSNFFMKHFDVRNQSAGVKLGQAITISALLIQGPFPTEDKDQHEDHTSRRQVQSAMLNVLDDARLDVFIEEGLTRREDMVGYCLQRMESPRITKHKAINLLQKYLNTTFFGPLGCTEKWRGTRLTYRYCIEAVN